MPVTMRDVAVLAGVSISTVSHVLNETRPVPETTRVRVLAAIQASGYMPNTLARSLKRAETRTLGLAIGDISNPYFTEVVDAVEEAARVRGYTVILTDNGESAEREMPGLRVLVGRRVDGLILAPSAEGGAEAVAYAQGHNIPVVQIDRAASPAGDYVVAANAAGARRLVRHLADLGHRRIGMLTGLPGLSSSQERIKGYRTALEDADIPFDPGLMAEGQFSPEPARRATLALMAMPDPPTALFASNNLMTLGAMRAFSELGLAVPGRIALAAFDDFAWADLFQPRLTTVAQPCRRIGELAVTLLLERMAEPDLPPRHIRLPIEIRHRESCGCLPGAAPIP